jgi:hypothetical protein
LILPYIVAWQTEPQGKFFLGSLVNPLDASVYVSAIRQGSEGNWFFHFQFSPEPLPPRLTYPLYLFIGRLAGLFGGSLLGWFHVFRILASIGTLLSILLFAQAVFPQKKQHQLSSWFLIVFGSGMGWLFAILFKADLNTLPDLTATAFGSLMPMLGTPHLSLGLGLEAVLFGCILQMQRVEKNGIGLIYAVTGSITGILIALIHTFTLPVIGLAVGIYLLALAFQEKTFPWRTWLNGAIILLPLLPFVYYFGVYARKDPYWDAAQFTNNIILPPPPIFLMIGLGLVGGLAVIGLIEWLKQKLDLLIPIWAIINIFCLYLPLPFSGRFILGLILPLGILAGYGLETVVLPSLQKKNFLTHLGQLMPTPLASLRRFILFSTIPSTILVMATLTAISSYRQDFPVYFLHEDAAASQWLAAETTSEDIIFAGYEVGNYLPRLFQGKVFLGHEYLTINLDLKEQLWLKFWRETTSPSWRREFLQKWGITHIYKGPVEQAISKENITPPGELVYQSDHVWIYHFIK